jgi:hypothetical protein
VSSKQLRRIGETAGQSKEEFVIASARFASAIARSGIARNRSRRVATGAASRHAKGGSAPSPASVRRFALACLCILALAAVFAAGAQAIQTHQHLFSFDGSGTPGGSFRPLKVAVDQSANVVYVLDYRYGTVDKFDDSGTPQNFSALSSSALDGAGAGQADQTPQDSIGVTGETDLAVDDSGTATDGNLYVASETGFLYAFDAAGNFLWEIDGSGPAGTPSGSLDNPCGVAVGSDGSLYVAGFSAAAVRKFTPSGSGATYVSETGVGSSPCHIAIDSADNLYVNHLSADVEKFDSAGVSQGQIDAGPANAVAVDPATDHVYVDGGESIREYDAAGTAISEFGQGDLSRSLGLAIEATSGRVFAIEETTESILVYGPLLTLTDVSTGPVSDISPTGATVSGQIDPAGGLEATCEFEYGTDTSYGQTAPCLPPGPFTSSALVSAELSGLTMSTTYHYRLSSTNSDGTNHGADQTFTTSGPPLVETKIATGVAFGEATLQGAVNPNSFATTYHFEYGPTTAYGTSTPTRSLPAGTTFQDVQAHLVGLSADTTYHFRIVASNSIDSAQSPDRAFRTFSQEGGHIEGRAYELVSPPDKAGNDVAANPWRTKAAVDGNAVSFITKGAFGDVGGTSIGVEYIAQRGPDGWTTHGLSPNQPPASNPYGALFNQTKYVGDPSPDLSKGVIFARTPLTDAPNVAKANNLYLRTNMRANIGPNPSDGAEYQLLTDSVNQLTRDESKPLSPYLLYTAQTADLGHIVFDDANNLTADASGEGPKAYEWDHGTLRLVGILPNGDPAPNSVAGFGAGVHNDAGVNASGGYAQHTISADGSRVVFNDSGSSESCGGLPDGGVCGAIYIRENHSVTIKVNVDERSVPDPDWPEPAPALFRGASADGSRVFFETNQKLLDADHNDVGDLYMYDLNAPAGEHLQLISVDNEPSDDSDRSRSANGVIGVSDDGQYVYFAGNGRLVSGQGPFAGNNPVTGSNHFAVYVWHDGSVRLVGFIQGLSSDNAVPLGGLKQHASRVSPNGKTIIYQTSGENPPYSNETPDCAQRSCVEVYAYNYDSDHLDCASCKPSGEVSGHSANFEALGDAAFTLGPESFHQNHALSDDGSKVFFSTQDSLVPQDNNGQWDAYEYDVDTGQRHLLSTGQCACDSYFVEATPSASDVFIQTRERLVGIDRDRNADLYDVRVGGGIAAQNALSPAECEGDACQPPASAPNDATPGSSTLKAPGNPKVKKTKKPKKHRHHKKHHHNQHGHHSQGNRTHKHG